MTKMKWTMHTPEAAPEASRPSLLEAKKTFGFVPNMLAGLAESPVALKGYMALSDLFAHSKLTPVEQQVVLLAASIENECEYCSSVHTVIATNTAKVPAPVIEALRNGGKLPDAKLDALATFTRTVVRKRGRVDEAIVKPLIEAGFQPAHVLDVMLGITMKTLSNYSHHIVGMPLDKEFESGRWASQRKAA